jgi:3-oxoacyl-[acyl-carrier-protein] synthase-3
VPVSTAAENHQIDPPDIKTSGAEIEEGLVRQLARVWIDFESQLNNVPIVKKIREGRLTVADYRELLFNLRQQVIDGSRWISRAASNLTTENFPIRSAFIGHSSDEHRDFEMLERDYASVGGNVEDIRAGTKNIGSTALSEFILGRASRENPFDLIGAMFIIEGLGRRVASRWARMIQEQLELEESQVSFLMYHSESDDVHFERLDLAVQSGILTREVVESVVKTAKVTARLYRLQLEEIGNF